MQLDQYLQTFSALHKQFGPVLDTGLLVLARMLGFIQQAPILNRKDLPYLPKLALALFFTCTLVWMIPVAKHGSWFYGNAGAFALQLIMNVVVGALIGFIADMVLQAVNSAGNLVNTQIGMSAAMAMDPTTRSQKPLMENLFAFLVALAFIHAGGMYWLVLALKKSFTVFPVYQINQPITTVIDMDYLILLSGNTLKVAVELAAPAFVVTLALDLILGVVNKAAQQIPVFQMSASLKPLLGIGILLLTLPLFMKVVMDYLHDFSQIF